MYWYGGVTKNSLQERHCAQYLHPSSLHPVSQKTGIWKRENMRYLLNATDETDYRANVNSLASHLIVRGYSRLWLNSMMDGCVWSEDRRMSMLEKHASRVSRPNDANHSVCEKLVFPIPYSAIFKVFPVKSQLCTLVLMIVHHIWICRLQRWSLRTQQLRTCGFQHTSWTFRWIVGGRGFKNQSYRHDWSFALEISTCAAHESVAWEMCVLGILAQQLRRPKGVRNVLIIWNAFHDVKTVHTCALRRPLPDTLIDI